MSRHILNILFYISAFAVLSASALYITQWSATPYIFAVGAAGMAITRLSNHYQGSNIRLKRLYRMETFSSLLIVAASYFMFKHQNEWFLLLFVAAILQLYTAILIPKIPDK